jgi:glycogen debranching enzyme
LPILLGKCLPVEIHYSLVTGLQRSGLITEYGLATENPRSPLYNADVYGRGPIWAPSTMLIMEGLAAMGEVKLASQISRKFCNMAARRGMSNIFDALTGQGLRDRTYTWTSSVFLALGTERLLSVTPEN